MNRSLIVLLSVVAIALAQLNCQTNGTTFQAVCTGATNANCSWENAAIWANCNSTAPDATNNNVLITANGITPYTMFLNGSAITAGNVTVNAPGSTLSVSEDLNVETITLQAGSVFVNSDITLAQNTSAFTLMNATSVSLNGGVITGSVVAQPGSTITFVGVNTISGLLTSSANIVMNTATATLNGLVSTLNGPISFSGANTLAGAGKLYVNGDLIMQQPAADTVTTVSITANVSGTFEANTTVNVNNDLKATTLTVDPTGAITLNTAAVPGSFNFSNVYVNDIVNTVANATTVSNGQLNWASGLLFSAGNIVNNGTWTISTQGTNISMPTVFGTVSSNGDIIINTPAVSIGHNINTDNLNIGGGTVQGAAGNVLTVEANITWTAGNITVPTLIALGQVTITGTGEGTYKMLSSAVSADNVKLSCALDLNTDYVNGGTFVGEAASLTSSNNYGATNFQNNGVLDGNINFSGVSLINAGTIGLINVSTQLAFTDASLTLTNTSRLIIGVGSDMPDPIFSFTRTNNSNVNITNTWAGSIEYVILGSFSPSSDTNITLQTWNGANIRNLPETNFSSVFTVYTNYTMMPGANANGCNFGQPIIDNANYQVIIPVTGCSSPSTGNKTLIIVIVIVVVVLVIAAIIGVVVYRRRQHAHSAEKQRLI